MIRNAEAWRTWPLPTEETSLEDWQADRCAWCGGGRSGLYRDHCHETGLIRGLLCSRCNQLEGRSSDPRWDLWRAGDHPAAALRVVEVYTFAHERNTPLRPGAVLSYYLRDEQVEWWESVKQAVADGGPFPAEAPWTEVAAARKDAEWERMVAAVRGLGGAA